MVYNLRNGYKVITKNVQDGKEFETRNGKGETISTVTLGYVAANTMLRDLLKVAA
jgi:hypothetical protein